MPPPTAPKIYHIVHVDRLSSIIDAGQLWSDAEIVRRAAANPGMRTTIGMNSIKERRLNELTLDSHPGVRVGQCVPFYFCPRSIMLYVIYRANHDELAYRGGQGSDHPSGSRPQPQRGLGGPEPAPLGVHLVERGHLLYQ